MAELASRRLREVLAALASPQEPPAAGVAAAITGAAAATLVELSAALAATHLSEGEEAATGARMGEIAERAGELRRRLLGAADDDVRAYAAVTAAEDGAARVAGLSRASEPPLVIAECASELAEAAAETVRAGEWDFRADAVVGGELAAAAAASSAELVSANLAGDPEDPRTDRARAAADRAARASRAAASLVRG
jgi:formiminotetrahydrofolate cyclodeaminase